MDEVIRTLRDRLAQAKERLRANREEMDAIQASKVRLQSIRDQATRRALVLGRITLYLESLPHLEDTSDLKAEIESLKQQIAAFEEELSDEVVEERPASIVSILSQDMIAWARELRLEHSEHPLRLDLNCLTLVADADAGPIPMDHMGNVENWVGYHLIVHFALHKWFTTKGRPVPQMLFVDQLSQVYFPPDRDIDGSMEGVGNEDRKAVSRMYRLALSVVQSVSPGLQIIMTDHADIAEPWFQECVRERWRGGHKLVPPEWLDEAEEGTAEA